MLVTVTMILGTTAVLRKQSEKNSQDVENHAAPLAVNPGMTSPESSKPQEREMSDRFPAEPKIDLNKTLSQIATTEGSAAALAAAKGSKRGDRESAILFVLIYLTSLDPEFVARELNTSGLSAPTKGMVVQSLISRWNPADNAFEWANTALTGQLRTRAVSLALGRIAEQNPSKALSIASEMPPGADRDQAMHSTLSSWAKVNHADALDYVLKLSDPVERASGMTQLASSWVEHDIESAKSYLADHPDEKLSKLAHLIALDGVATDPAGTLDWLEPMAGNSAARAKRSALIAWADSNIIDAARYVEAAAPDARSELALILSGTWAAMDPIEAARWVERWPEEQLQARLVVEVLRRWYSNYPVEAMKWVNSLPEGTAKGSGRAFIQERESGVPLRRTAQELQDGFLFARKTHRVQPDKSRQ